MIFNKSKVSIKGLLIILFLYACTTSNLRIEVRVQELLSKMTLEEKIGQMSMVERRFLKDINDIKSYYLGVIISSPDSPPPDPDTPSAWADMVNTYQSVALETRLGIPILYGTDAVHGHNNVRSSVIFPHNIGMGCTRNPELVRKAFEITAKEVAVTGIHWTFSPCLAVPRDERWGRTYEGFGESPEVVTMMAKAAIDGLQGDVLGAPNTILACAKHFIGDGGTTGGIDQGDTQVDEKTLREIHLPGYLTAIEAGVGSIMVSHSSWNGDKMHSHKYLLTTVLKGELGFDGILLSDWESINQLPGDYKSDIESAINAGLDMIMIPEHYQEFTRLLRELVLEEKVLISRIDDAVSRILRKKFELGLFDHPLVDKSFIDSIGSPEHREVARACVRESVVLLKNEDDLLPLPKDISRIHVSGKNADDIGNQCGAWTINWQGGSGKVTEGTTILEGIKNTVSEKTEVSFSLDGTGAEGADVGIIVIGELPYVEWEGDKDDLSLDSQDIVAIDNVLSAGIPVVIVIISGRPLIIEPELKKWNALLAAWLPGTEGQGVADILFGDYNPTGHLSMTWPRIMSQVPINIGDTEYAPLFEYGYGLSY